MTITGGSALSKDDIDKMVKDAEMYAEEDRKAKEAVEIRNQGESLVHSTEKFVVENEDKIGEDVKTEVKADVDALKESLKGEDVDAIQGAIAKLGDSSQKMGAAMYEAAAAASAAEGGSDAESTDDSDDVVEAEIVDEESATDSGAGEGESK